MGLHGTNGGECPAAATVSLVLYWSHTFNISPVPERGDLIGGISTLDFVFVSVSSWAFILGWCEVEIVHKLIISEIRVAIDSLLVGLGMIFVVSNDLFKSIGKDRLSICIRIVCEIFNFFHSLLSSLEFILEFVINLSNFEVSQSLSSLKELLVVLVNTCEDRRC